VLLTVKSNQKTLYRQIGSQFQGKRHQLLTSIRTTPEALQRLIRQRWSEDAHRYANRTGAPVFSCLRTVVMNLLRRGGYRSIRQSLRELGYDTKGMLALGGVTTPAPTT
jgi:hypothetical protein